MRLSSISQFGDRAVAILEATEPTGSVSIGKERNDMNRHQCVFILVSSLALLVACGDSSSPTSSTPPTTTTTTVPTTDTRTVKDNPSYANDIQEIFQRRVCTNAACHGAAAAAGLSLQPGVSYGNLVNVMATSEAVLRVIPNNADGSYLVIKLEGRQTVGARMPLGGQPLDTTDITNIRNWITQGANNN
jgi:hypothetical protein